MEQAPASTEKAEKKRGKRSTGTKPRRPAKRREKRALTDHDLLTRDRISLEETAQRLGVSTRTVRRLSARGEFPQLVRFSRNTVGVLVSDYRKWLESRPAARIIEEETEAA